MGRHQRDHERGMVTVFMQCPRDAFCTKTAKHRGACYRQVGGRAGRDAARDAASDAAIFSLTAEVRDVPENAEDSIQVIWVKLKSLPATERVAARQLLVPQMGEVISELQLAESCYQQADEVYERVRGQGSKVSALVAKFERERAIAQKVHENA